MSRNAASATTVTARATRAPLNHAAEQARRTRDGLGAPPSPSVEPLASRDPARSPRRASPKAKQARHEYRHPRKRKRRYGRRFGGERPYSIHAVHF